MERTPLKNLIFLFTSIAFLCLYSQLSYSQNRFFYLADNGKAKNKLKSVSSLTNYSTFKKYLRHYVEYDTNGNEIKDITYNDKGEILSQFINAYDKNQNYLSHTRYEKEAIYYWCEWKYNNKGDLIYYVKYIARNNQKFEDETYTYKGDEKTIITSRYDKGKVWRKTEEIWNKENRILFKEYALVGGSEEELFVQSFYRYKYNKKGLLTEELEYDEHNGKESLRYTTTYTYTDFDSLSEFNDIYKNEKYYYNENRQIIKKEIIVNSLITFTIYNYENNKLMEEVELKETDSGLSKQVKIKYTYHDNGVLKSRFANENTHSDVPKDYISESEYNNKGKLIKNVCKWYNGEIFTTTLHEYDERGNCIYTYIKNNAEVTEHWKMKYNDANEILEYCTLDTNGKVLIKKTYEYNKQGYMEKELYSGSKEKYYIEYRYDFYK